MAPNSVKRTGPEQPARSWAQRLAVVLYCVGTLLWALPLTAFVLVLSPVLLLSWAFEWAENTALKGKE